MARSFWQRITDCFGGFVQGVSRQLSDVWTTPAAMAPRLEELGVTTHGGRGSRSSRR